MRMSHVIIRSVSLSDPVRACGAESRYLRARPRAIRRGGGGAGVPMQRRHTERLTAWRRQGCDMDVTWM